MSVVIMLIEEGIVPAVAVMYNHVSFIILVIVSAVFYRIGEETSS